MKRFLQVALLLGACSTPTPLRLEVDSGDAPVPAYSRRDWGHWVDVDHDCQDTRQEVLIAESEIPVTLSADGCQVLAGRWTCPYSGDVILDPRKLDIDHMVPLRAAHTAGGAAWGSAKKSAYFNDLVDPQHLIAVSYSANRSKGDRGPTEWLPPNPQARCKYIQDWVAVKTEWGLRVPEADAIKALLAANCP